MVVRTDHFPAAGQTIMGGEFFMFSGGKGANQAVAAARMEAEVFFIGNTGGDIFGHRAIEMLNKEGINTDFICMDQEKPSGIALILVDRHGENEIVVAPGANATLSEQHISKAEKIITESDLILLQLEIPLDTVIFAAELGARLQKKVILNPAPAQPLPDELLQHLFLITPNETEAEILTGIKIHDQPSAAKAASVLLSKGVKQVVITLGPKGAFYKSDQFELMVEAPKVNAVDTTAAGDVFNGALAVEISNGKDWKSAISFACKAASLSVTQMGAQASMPMRSDIS
ncbi:ribokinase [Flavihumibacter fluvii]|nr:ribokinase [Flavihumibacter fluvii]